MVNRGASQGCITCKKRRVKCDETKPACKECIRLQRKCEGYGKQAVRLRFRDETGRYLNRSSDHTTATGVAIVEVPKKRRRSPPSPRPFSLSRTGSNIAIPRSPQYKQQDVAVAFFLTYVIDVGRNLESTRGFFEFVCPALARESHESALSTAVNATAAKLWALLRPSDTATSIQVQLHNQALGKLREAVLSPFEQKREATVLAALMLQQHDTLAAVFRHHEAQSTHREGALALLRQQGRNMRDSKYYGHLLGNLFHSKISFCVRHEVPLTESELHWLQTEVIPVLPSNPSSLLDVIGISISSLQNILAKCVGPQRGLALDALQDLPGIVHNADTQLRAWLSAVSDFWRPKRMEGENMIPSSVTTYLGSCEIYPSIQIANIWNTWRLYCLIAEYAKLQLTSGFRGISPGDNFTSPAECSSAQTLRKIQDLVEAICRSMPFYLGNRLQPVNYSDIDDPELVVPSYHDLPPTGEAFINYKNSAHYASKIDHYRHVALHGPLHALTILSSLTSLLSDERCSELDLDAPKQWIDQQFHRALYLMRFSPPSQYPSEQRHLASSDNVHKVHNVHQSSPSLTLAQAIRHALCTVNIV